VILAEKKTIIREAEIEKEVLLKSGKGYAATGKITTEKVLRLLVLEQQMR